MASEREVLTREEERDLRKWAKSAGGCGCNLRWHRLFVTLDAERARADAAEADAAALRGALNNWLAAGCCPGFEIQCGSYSGCDAETTKATDCPSCGPLRAALAPGAGTRVALQLKQAENMVAKLLVVLDKLGKDHPLHGEMCAALFVPDPQPPLTQEQKDYALTLRPSAVSALDGEGARDGK